LQPESKLESDSQFKKIIRPGPRFGLKNFRTGAELESEKVTLATSGCYFVSN